MGRLLKEMMVIGLGGLAAVYLLNPTLGAFELIPDFLPIVGNLDEAGATLLLLNAFRYYGVDLQRLFGKRTPQTPQLPDERR
ncbi:MAG: YkvA family protein [Chloroflexota bacterium]